ncbi:alpha/beta hydrolase [Streptacidiphilus sp. EB129]|uniref:alpha/beta hydrolase n=1 Tax=Streptacidiphilus sp. EB129 TaxID=3156262 RepID=UPI0035199BFB
MPSRPRRGALRRTLLTALVTAAVAVPVSGAAGATAVPAPTPAALAPLTAATPALLDARYAAGRADIQAAERMAADYGDQKRAAELGTLAQPSRHFLSFDGRDGGRTVEVFGDLAGADRVAVLVPGSDTNLDTYPRFRADAVALQRQLGPGAAVIAWLGYPTPSTESPDVLTTGLADQAAPQLQQFVRELSAIKPTARTSVVCHSYGSVVCARAASGLDVTDIVLIGSPGVGNDSATVAGLHTRAAVWAGRGATDWVRDVPHVRVQLAFATLGFGADPVSPGYGATIFPAGEGGHSDYLKSGSVALANIARIVSGEPVPGASGGSAATGPTAAPSAAPASTPSRAFPASTPSRAQEADHA